MVRLGRLPVVLMKWLLFILPKIVQPLSVLRAITYFSYLSDLRKQSDSGDDNHVSFIK